MKSTVYNITKYRKTLTIHSVAPARHCRVKKLHRGKGILRPDTARGRGGVKGTTDFWRRYSIIIPSQRKIIIFVSIYNIILYRHHTPP